MTTWNLNLGVYRLPCFSDTISASFKGLYPADDVYYSTPNFSTQGGSYFGGQSQDAFVEYSMTMAEVAEFDKSQGVSVIGSYAVLPEEEEKGSVSPDEVYMAWQSPLPKSRRDALLREALIKIRESLAKGQKREWRCCQCKTVQRYENS